MAEKKKEGGMFGGLGYKPIGWDQNAAPALPLKTDNPFLQEARPAEQPLQPIAPADKNILAGAMTDWYKAGKPAKVATKQKFSDEDLLLAAKDEEDRNYRADSAAAVGSMLNINPANWEAMLAGTPPSKNVEGYQEPALETILAGLKPPGGPLEPVLSVPAAGRIQKRGDDPLQDMQSQLGQPLDPLAMVMGLFGGPRVSPRIFAPPTPPVMVDLMGPGVGGYAGVGKRPYISDSMKAVSAKAENYNVDPTITNGPVSWMQQQNMIRNWFEPLPSGEIIPLKGTHRGNIRNQTEAEMLGAIDRQWAQMAAGNSSSTTPTKEQLIQEAIDRITRTMSAPALWDQAKAEANVAARRQLLRIIEGGLKP